MKLCILALSFFCSTVYSLRVPSSLTKVIVKTLSVMLGRKKGQAFVFKVSEPRSFGFLVTLQFEERSPSSARFPEARLKCARTYPQSLFLNNTEKTNTWLCFQ